MMAVMVSAEAAKKAQQPVVTVCDLRTERLVNPMSIDTPTPRLGWRIESTVKDVMQTAYHLIVASTQEKAEAMEGDLWDVTNDRSINVPNNGSRSQWIPYEGKALKSNTRCYWRVNTDAYFSSAASKPSSVLPKLIQLSMNHQRKLSDQSVIYYNKLIGGVIDGLNGEFPQTLDLDGQGRFIVGYYQQKQAFYTKKTDDGKEG